MLLPIRRNVIERWRFFVHSPITFRPFAITMPVTCNLSLYVHSARCHRALSLSFAPAAGSFVHCAGYHPAFFFVCYPRYYLGLFLCLLFRHLMSAVQPAAVFRRFTSFFFFRAIWLPVFSISTFCSVFRFSRLAIAFSPFASNLSSFRLYNASRLQCRKDYVIIMWLLCCYYVTTMFVSRPRGDHVETSVLPH